MKKITFVFLLLTSASCDCIQEAGGTVVDAKTGLPLEGVSYQGKWETQTTGPEGGFSYRGISGGLFGCPPVIFTFKKEGYRNKKITIGNFESRTVKMKPIKKN